MVLWLLFPDATYTRKEPGHLWRAQDPVRKHTGWEGDPQTSSHAGVEEKDCGTDAWIPKY